jgi:lambda family phage minor tail protein L
MPTLTALLEQHRSQLEDEKPWIWLYEIRVPTDPATRYRLTNYTEPVSFGTSTAGAPLVYSPFPIVHGGIVQTKEGDLPTIQVSVGNVTREIGAALEAHAGLVGACVVIRLVNRDTLADLFSQVREDSLVQSSKATHVAVDFTLAPYNLYQAQFPRNRFLRNYCEFLFGGLECGYAIPPGATGTLGGGFTTCGKTFAQCDERGLDELLRGVTVGHPLRFGGFLGIPKLSSKVGL